MSEQEFLQRLKAFCRTLGGQSQAAKRIGITRGHLSRVLGGEKHAGTKMAAFFGLKPVVSYEKI